MSSRLLSASTRNLRQGPERLGTEPTARSAPGLRRRLLGGAGGQLSSNISLAVVQLGTVLVLVPAWGVRTYGAWLILSAVPTYIAVSELGLFSAATSEMTMSVARGEYTAARDVFQAISRGVGAIFAVLLVLVPLFVAVAPLSSWLNLKHLAGATVSAVIVMMALRTLLISYAGLLYGGFASAGHYGRGTAYMTAITFFEFVALITVALIGRGPAVAAAAMLVCRVAGDALMYRAMRRRAPWLSFGKPAGKPRVIRRLLRPGLASTAIGSGVAINLQGMIILIGVVLGPTSVAIFATVRTMTRLVFQVLSSISQTVGPELARAYGENDGPLLRKLQRRASQASLWIAAPLLVGLAIFGSTIIHVWTHGRISAGGLLLYLFLIAAGIDSLWFTCGGILYWTNRHPRVAVIYMVSSIASLGLAYVLLDAWGLVGGAGALIALELLMLAAVLKQSLPAAHDTLRGWASAVVKPPGWAVHALRASLVHAPGAES